jgi:hypothetical protein
MSQASFPIFDKLGGIEATFDLLRGNGFAVTTVDALRMWRSPRRAQIPGAAVVALMRICERLGIAYAAEDFSLSVVDESEMEAA